jgi:hypothetical protein
MLGWETDMPEDLALLYPAYPEAPQTPGSGQVARFVDETVANHDVRALKDSAGRTILLYGYRDKQTLIIARDEAAFTALLVRLGASGGK